MEYLLLVLIEHLIDYWFIIRRFRNIPPYKWCLLDFAHYIFEIEQWQSYRMTKYKKKKV